MVTVCEVGICLVFKPWLENMTRNWTVQFQDFYYSKTVHHNVWYFGVPRYNTFLNLNKQNYFHGATVFGGHKRLSVFQSQIFVFQKDHERAGFGYSKRKQIFLHI